MPMPGQNSRTPRLLLLLGLLAAIAAVVVFLPVQETLQRFLEWLQGVGIWGPILLGALYIPAAVFFVPGSLLTLGAGFAFGIASGAVAVSIGSTLGAAAAFLAGRKLVRSFVEEKVARYPRFQAIDRAVGRNGFKIVLLIRISPIFPFNFLNYAFGITGVGFRDYVLGSWIGMLPGTLMYVYLGSAAQNLTALAAGETGESSGKTALFVAGLLATIAVTVFVTRIARRALREEVPEAGSPAPS
ncbi:MAG: TVP38/TMEM64 family protein [Planctomycetota bacterium]